jgi:undecaprenyl-diphosphatase
VKKLAIGILENPGKPFGKFDNPIVKFTRKKENRALNWLTTVISDTGEPWTLYPVSGVLAFKWLSRNRRTDTGALAMALVGSAIVNKGIKGVAQRPRPSFKLHLSKSQGSSFPSNHTTMSVATYGTMAYLMARRRRQMADVQAVTRLWTPAFLFCTLIGGSRIYQGVHHPSDVLGGAVAGSVWLAACGVARHFMERYLDAGLI